jgi:eukaryotic-like serine/threonine-protein kinase
VPPDGDEPDAGGSSDAVTRMEPSLTIGRYELLEHIGNGSLSVLYRGRDTVLDREVAVKVLAAGFLGDASAHVDFFREAKAAARLQHVNIVTIFEFGKHDETPFIVMEYLRGRNLAERLRKKPALSLAEKLETAIQLTAGLEAAHAQDVVHRDVKPRNVWICEDGTVKLLDFGMGVAALSTASHDIMGSLSYLSPEQVSGKEVDARSDIFSAGVVMYELFSGRRPFEADSPTGVMMKIVNDSAAPIVDATLPSGISYIVSRAMEKSPAARYARASDLRRDLSAIKGDLPHPAEPATPATEATLIFAPPPPPPEPERVEGKLSRFLAGLRRRLR